MIKRYEDCRTSLETRADHPPTRAYIDHLIAGLETSGVDALWHSVVGPRALPLFPSAVFPVHHPQADAAIFRELVTRVHAAGRTILCWYPLHLCQSLLQVHPEWRLQWYDFDNGDPATGDPPADCICPNSPYRELLPQFLAEVTREFDFDGFWLDGAIYSLHWGTFSPGCRCDFCRARFRADTGLDLPAPATINKQLVTDPVAKRWIKWRYDVFMDFWQGCITAVAAVKPSATLAFNNLRHREFNGWNFGIPLRTLGFDCVMSTETCTFPAQADLQMKLLRAYQCRRGVDSWQALSDHGYVWSPDMEPLTFTQGLLAALAAGGNTTPFGTGCDLRHVAPVLRDLHALAAARADFRGGASVEHIAILASQATEDYYTPLARHAQAYHGANELCRHGHLLTSIIFDDYLDRDDLARYPVVLLGNAACLSATQAATLARYVQAGGMLVATHETGTRDEWGDPHPRPVLDDLLGLADRGTLVPTLPAALATVELRQACGELVTFQCAATLATPALDCEVLAWAVSPGAFTSYPQANTWSPGRVQLTGVDEPPAAPAVAASQPAAARRAALWRRRVGQGWVVYLAADLCPAYLHAPTSRVARLFRAVVTACSPPPVTLTGPACVSLNARVHHDGRWAVHLHNAPGGLYRYPQPLKSDQLRAVGEVVPVRDLVVHVHGRRILVACSGLTGQALAVLDGTRVMMPELALHDVILLTLA